MKVGVIWAHADLQRSRPLHSLTSHARLCECSRWVLHGERVWKTATGTDKGGSFSGAEDAKGAKIWGIGITGLVAKSTTYVGTKIKFSTGCRQDARYGTGIAGKRSPEIGKPS
jgi:hypothetical protein